MRHEPDPLSGVRERLQSEHGVSRETFDRLAAFVGMVEKWQPRINLIAPASMSEIWVRHVLDSVQLDAFRPAGPLLDLGSGGGFPGLVLALLRDTPVHLVEADQRKAVFLREAARVTEAPVFVHACRIETLDRAIGPFAAVTARALAPLARLLALAKPHLDRGALGIFAKGRSWGDELTEAQREWHIKVETRPSVTEPEAAVILIRLMNVQP